MAFPKYLYMVKRNLKSGFCLISVKGFGFFRPPKLLKDYRVCTNKKFKELKLLILINHTLQNNPSD